MDDLFGNFLEAGFNAGAELVSKAVKAVPDLLEGAAGVAADAAGAAVEALPDIVTGAADVASDAAGAAAEAGTDIAKGAAGVAADAAGAAAEAGMDIAKGAAGVAADAAGAAAEAAPDVLQGAALHVAFDAAGLAADVGVDVAQQRVVHDVVMDHAFSNIASLAKGLASSVHKQSTELATSVAVTDWRKELRDFGSALQEDITDINDNIKHGDAAGGARVPTDLSSHLDGLGTHLENLGRNLIKNTHGVIASVKETVDHEMDVAATLHNSALQRRHMMREKKQEERAQRTEQRIAAMQRDSSTYCDEPEDQAYFAVWRAHAFVLADRKDEIASILKTTAFMQELQSRIVPLIVDYDTFWTQYFFRLHEIKVDAGLETKVKEGTPPPSPKQTSSPPMEEGEGAEVSWRGPSAGEKAKEEEIEEKEDEKEETHSPATERKGAPKRVEGKRHPPEAKEYLQRVVATDGVGPASPPLPQEVGDSPQGAQRAEAESEPEAATASDSSATDWVDIKTKKRGGGSGGGGGGVSEGAGPAGVGGNASPSPSPSDSTSDPSSPLPSPRADKPHGLATMDEMDEDIDEDWGEV